ncbi:unnamed protein product [Chondrus crispus]|uniref:Aspartyl/asparaginy/proline hydroxylase domain-containing protein n=1 Tax=Chondrus crispus TaxID=2769 RepID=R7QQ79_CHOCR|nr:unnamed protein product [Chondrus crispus]CDF40652.1 unnamed protein product [Chondrus crispus]|eukprot:XP_005710946.1 unnamed protein product [Chondrus crispus]
MRNEVSLADTILKALENEFRGKSISRVIQSFRNVVDGKKLEVNEGEITHQRATSFIEGLDATPFIEDFDNDYQWVRHLENNWETIAAELREAMKQKDIQRKGNNIWAPPVVEAANAYGPDWRTLVLQDRVWDPVNINLFPKTTAILQDSEAHVPSVEAFFARQAAGTGIKLHTDDCNFILTMHLALSAPEKQSWIEVAGERRYWENGKGLVFNTSFFHQTMNESNEQDRVVLLIRFWHPQLRPIEREALSFLFQAIDNPDGHPSVVKARRQLRAQGSSPPQRPRGRGFGA